MARWLYNTAELVGAKRQRSKFVPIMRQQSLASHHLQAQQVTHVMSAHRFAPATMNQTHIATTAEAPACCSAAKFAVGFCVQLPRALTATADGPCTAVQPRH